MNEDAGSRTRLTDDNARGALFERRQTGRLKAAPTKTAGYFFVALQAAPVPVVPFIELPLTVPV